MDGLNLPTPNSLFGTLSVAISSTAAIATCVENYPNKNFTQMWFTLQGVRSAAIGGAGGSVMVGNAAVIGRLAIIAGACAASFYAGACVGSLYVATYKRFSPTLIDYLNVAKQYYFEDSWLMDTISKNPQLVRQLAFRGR